MIITLVYVLQLISPLRLSAAFVLIEHLVKLIGPKTIGTCKCFKQTKHKLILGKLFCRKSVKKVNKVLKLCNRMKTEGSKKLGFKQTTTKIVKN